MDEHEATILTETFRHHHLRRLNVQPGLFFFVFAFSSIRSSWILPFHLQLFTSFFAPPLLIAIFEQYNIIFKQRLKLLSRDNVQLRLANLVQAKSGKARHASSR